MIVSSDIPTSTGTDRVWGLPIVVLGGLQLLTVLDGTVVALALPRIREGLGLSEAGGNWIITAYVLAFGGLMLLGGRLGDAFGRRRVFVAGVAAFTLTSLLCGLAWGPVSLVAGRALQGMAAAVAAPTSMALVATTYTPGRARSHAFAIYAALSGIGSVAGLIAGGVLTQMSWRLVFLINVPIGLLVTLGALVCLRESGGERGRLDIAGAVLATTGVTLLVLAVNEGPGGWVRPVVIVPGAVAVLLLSGFVMVERRAENPLVPFALFGNPSRVAALLAIVLAGGVIMCLAVFISLYLQGVLRYSPMQSGFAVIPFAIGFAGAAAAAARLALRVQPRWLVIAGGGVIVAGCLYAAAITSGRPAYFPGIALPILAVGFGVGFAVVPLTLSIVAGVGAREIGPLSALAQVAQNLGGAVGLVAVGAAAASRDGLAEGYGLAFVCCAGIAVVAGIVVLFMRFTPAQVAEGQLAERAAHGEQGLSGS
ncbi:putative MFS-type transporter EfpA [Nocardia seriolae]|uniref:MFS-type transporter EfpA n=1 Tax=Nocardia seriolae TaxID=37332 RepID=A0ABC8AZA1_9NOCA|nr:MFS transporter [Nocardia seriolae]APA99326.1 putative MFS-type transporter EfpA [Nocardia seriolae]